MENAIGRDRAKWLLRKAGVDPYADRVWLRRLSKLSGPRAREELAARVEADRLAAKAREPEPEYYVDGERVRRLDRKFRL